MATTLLGPKSNITVFERKAENIWLVFTFPIAGAEVLGNVNIVWFDCFGDTFVENRYFLIIQNEHADKDTALQGGSGLLRRAEHPLPFAGAEGAQNTGERGFNCLEVHKNPPEIYETIARPGPHIRHRSIQVRYGIKAWANM